MSKLEFLTEVAQNLALLFFCFVVCLIVNKILNTQGSIFEGLCMFWFIKWYIAEETIIALSAGDTK